MAITVALGSHLSRTEFDEVSVRRMFAGRPCNAVLTAAPEGSEATVSSGSRWSYVCATFTPDRWGVYEVTTGRGTYSSPYETTTIEFWPVAYEAVVAWDLTIPIAGIYPRSTGDMIAIYGEPTTRRAEEWWDAVTVKGSDARARSSDGINFELFGQAPRRATLIEAAAASGSTIQVNHAGYGRIRDLGSEWVMHTVHGDGTEAVPSEFWRWTDTRGPYTTWAWDLSAGLPAKLVWVAVQRMSLEYPHTDVVDWKAVDFDEYMLRNVQDSILEPLPTGDARLLMAYQTGGNRVAMLHMPVVSGYADGGFERPDDCDSSSHLDAANPCEPFVGEDDRDFGVDTPWFFPEFVEPFGTQSIRLTALFHPKRQEGEMRENTGWASWRREVGAEEEIWEYEGMFFTLDHSQEGMRSDSSIAFNEDDHTCAQGDHTIVTLDGIDYVYVPVGNFRGWWISPSTTFARRTAYEDQFVTFLYEDYTNAQEINYVEEKEGEENVNWSFTVDEILDRFSITATSSAVTGFDCSYCVTYVDELQNTTLPVNLVFVREEGLVNIYELEYEEPDLTRWTPRPCELVLAGAFLKVVGPTWEDSVWDEGDLDEVSAGFTALCHRYCTDTSLVLATSSAVRP